MTLFRFIPGFLLLFLLPFLAGCSDQRATFEIKGNAHALSLIRVTTFPWDSSARYAIVAARMPDCMRKHALPEAPLNASVEVFSPGNDAWIIRQNSRLFVTETRTCEGFASLDRVPDEGLGVPVGVFEMRDNALVFVAAPKIALPPPSPVAEPEPVAAAVENAPPEAAAPTPAKN